MAPERGMAQRLGRRLKLYAFFTFVAFGIGASATWVYREEIFRFLYRPAGGNLSPFDGLPIFTSPIEMLGLAIGLAVKGGMLAAIPVVVFSLYRLLAPFMSRDRRRFICLFLPVMGLFYIGGTAFAYFVILPTGMRFLLSFGEGVAVPVITVTAYLSLVTALIFWLGIVFEIPLVMYLLAKLRLVSHKTFLKVQKYVPVAALALSMFITPGDMDPVNQALVAAPIAGLYEAGILLAWMARPMPPGHVGILSRVKRRMCWLPKKVSSLVRWIRLLPVKMGALLARVKRVVYRRKE